MEQICVGNKITFKSDLLPYNNYGGKTFGFDLIDRIKGATYFVSEVKKKLREFKIVEEYRWFSFDMVENVSTVNLSADLSSLKDLWSFTPPNTSTITFCSTEEINLTAKADIKKKVIEPMKPFEIKAKLDEYVIGQEDAKIALSIAAYSHYLRINQEDSNDIEIQKGNVLMIGCSGSGKTLIVETLAKILDVPFSIVDITEFAPTGIVGKHTEDIIKELKQKAGGDSKKAERGIVFIDEIDKLATSNSAIRGNRNGILSSETQATLLKLLEGKETSSQNNNSFTSMFVDSGSSFFNTKNVLFICAGAFSGIEEIIDKENNQNGSCIGFGSPMIQLEKTIRRNVEANDVIEYGLMPEIVGRLPIIVNLYPLKKEDMVTILTKPKNAIVKQYKKLFEMAGGVELEFSDDALNTIADLALKNNVGARGLRTIVESVINRALFTITKDGSIKKCIITEECISKKSEPIMIKE